MIRSRQLWKGQHFVFPHMANLPPHIHTQKNGDGTGLFALEAIPPGVEILRIDRPLVSVLDSPHLKDTCSECYSWLPENGDDGDLQRKGLRACQGCKITKYCCKVCVLFLHAARRRTSCHLFEAIVFVYSKVSFRLPCLLYEVSWAVRHSIRCHVNVEQTCPIRERYSCISRLQHPSNALLLAH